MTNQKSTYIVTFKPDSRGFKVEEARIMSDKPVQVREQNRFSGLIGNIQKLIVGEFDKQLEDANAEAEQVRKDLEEKEQLLEATSKAASAVYDAAMSVVKAANGGNNEELLAAIAKLGELIAK